MIILALLGSMRIQALFANLNEGILIQNEVMEMAGAGAGDTQDDFRNSKYDLVKKHSEDNLKKYLFGKRESVSGIEGKMLLSEYLNKVKEDTLLLKPKKDISFNLLIKKEYIIIPLTISIIIHIFAAICRQIRRGLKFILLWRNVLYQEPFPAKTACSDMKNKEEIWKTH